MIRLLTIIGARPQIIKAAAISRAVRSKFAGQIEEKILHTGQHYDDNMSEVFFRELGIPAPDYNLHVGSGSHGAQTAKIIQGIEDVLLGKGDSYINQKNTEKNEESSITGSDSSSLDQMSAQEQALGQPSAQSCLIDSVAQTLSDDSSQKIQKINSNAASNNGDFKPFDGVIVYGDTNSTLAAAVAAAKIHVPVFHIEAGLRSFNMAMPEEQNRIVCDALSSILFAPTDTAVKNLAYEGFIGKQENYNENTFGENNNYINQKNIKKEESSVTDSDSTMLTPQSACMQASRQTDDSSCLTDTNAQCLSDDSYPDGTIISSQKTQKNFSSEAEHAKNAENASYGVRKFANGKGQIVVLSGDVMYDNSMYFSAMADMKSDIIERLGLSYRNFVLATIHRPANTDNAANLKSIFRALLDIAEREQMDIILPLHPRTRKMLPQQLSAELLQRVEQNEHLRITEPASFFEIIRLEKNARVVMTDSGGVQKEAFFYGTPCVILRPETEWVEIVDAGAGILADADYERIMKAYEELSGREVKFPPLFGDAHASEKILQEIINYLG